MAEVGSVHIAGSIDVSNIKHGLGEMKRSLDEMKDSAVGSFGDLKRLGGSLAGVAGPLVKIGAGLTTAGLGIAMLSPQVAPALARMEIGFEKLSRILGEELQPIFDDVANMFVGFVEWMDSDGRPVLDGFVGAFDELKTAIEGLANIGEILIGPLEVELGEVLGWIVENFSLEALGFFLGGLPGGVAVAGITGGAQLASGETEKKIAGGDVGGGLLDFIGIGAAAGAGTGALLGGGLGAIGGPVGLGIGYGAGAAIGGVAGGAAGLGMGLLEMTDIDEVILSTLADFFNFSLKDIPANRAIRYLHYGKGP